MEQLSRTSVITTCVIICLLAATALAQVSREVASPAELGPGRKFDRQAFLDFLRSTPEATAEQLKPFYSRPIGQPPLRESRWEGRRSELETLGERLFFDPRLSVSGQISCATCHNPAFHWSDRLPVSTENSSRRSMPLYNLAWDDTFLWNGRAGSLMQQAILALTATKGMHANLSDVSAKLSAIPEYRREFSEAFELAENAPSVITFSKVALAFEVFVSGIESPPSSFDRWVEGDGEAIPETARRGFLLFNGKARCAQCHNSWRFSDGQVHNTGLRSQCEEARDPDTKNSWNHGLFKAIGLREIAGRGPYMHDGSITSLQEVVAFYNRGGDTHCQRTDSEIRPLGLTTEEQRDLVSFLETLGEGSKPYLVPALPQ